MNSPAHWSTQIATKAVPEAAPESEPQPTLVIVGGDNQTAPLVMTEHGFPMASFGPISVQLRDADGSPLAGEAVAWSVGETPGKMGVQLDPHGASPCYTVTDEQGVAVLDRMRGNSASAFYDSGSFTLIARYGGASAIAHVTILDPPVLHAKFISGDNQNVARTGNRVVGGEAAFAPLTIRLLDSAGDPVPGISVLFDAEGPGGMMIRLEPASSSTVAVSDNEGLITLNKMGGNSMVCSGCDGAFKVIATPQRTKPIVSHQNVGAEPGGEPA